MPHLVIDTNDFLWKLPKQIMGPQTLVAVDVVQLFSSISNELGKEALSYWFNKYPENNS